DAAATVLRGLVQELAGRRSEHVGGDDLRVLWRSERADAHLAIHRRVPDVEELGAEIEIEALGHLGVLHNVDIPVLQTRPALAVPPEIARRRTARAVVGGDADIARLARIDWRVVIIRVDVACG